MPFLERAAMAEEIAGMLTKHLAYLAPGRRQSALPTSPKMAPILRDPTGPALAEAARAGRLTAKHMGIEIARSLPRAAPAILKRVDGIATLGEIQREIAVADAKMDWPRFQSEFTQVFDALAGLNLIWLRR